MEAYLNDTIPPHIWIEGRGIDGKALSVTFSYDLDDLLVV